MEVPVVLAGLLLLSEKKSEPEPGVIPRQERNAILEALTHLLAEDAGPEARQTDGVVRIKAERNKATSHSAPYLPIC